MSRGLLFSDTV